MATMCCPTSPQVGAAAEGYGGWFVFTPCVCSPNAGCAATLLPARSFYRLRLTSQLAAAPAITQPIARPPSPPFSIYNQARARRR